VVGVEVPPDRFRDAVPSHVALSRLSWSRRGCRGVAPELIMWSLLKGYEDGRTVHWRHGEEGFGVFLRGTRGKSAMTVDRARSTMALRRHRHRGRELPVATVTCDLKSGPGTARGGARYVAVRAGH